MGKLSFEDFNKLSNKEKCIRYKNMNDYDKLRARMTEHIVGGKGIGYIELTNDLKNKGKKMIEEASIVKEIFDECLKGKTCFQISKIMKEKYPKIFACYRKDKKTGEQYKVYRSWTDASISKNLNNLHYIGIYEFRKNVKDKDTIPIEGLVPPLISEETFYLCQEQLKKEFKKLL